MTTISLAASAQDPGRTYRIGYLGPAQTSAPAIAHYRAFLAQMRELGFQDGQNLHVEFRAIEDTRGPSVNADELVRVQPELIVVAGPAVALQSVVGTNQVIPIVMIAFNFDPIVADTLKAFRDRAAL